MQASIFHPKVEYFKPVFLNIHNRAWLFSDPVGGDTLLCILLNGWPLNVQSVNHQVRLISYLLSHCDQPLVCLLLPGMSCMHATPTLLTCEYQCNNKLG